MSIIDLGPYLSFGAENNDLELQDNLEFEHLVSPGIYFTFNFFKNYPLLFGFGGAYTPNLRDDENGDAVSVLRYQAFLSMDLTLFPVARGAARK